jgi:hypothetical protein
MTQVARSLRASLLLVALWPAAAAAQGAPPPAPAASPAATPTPVAESPAVDKRAKAEFLAWQKGSLDKSQYTNRLSDVATDAVVTQVSPQLKALGDVLTVQFTAGWVLKAVDVNDNAYQYLVTCSKGSMMMLYVLTPEGKVDGIKFRPATPTQ